MQAVFGVAEALLQNDVGRPQKDIFPAQRILENIDFVNDDLRPIRPLQNSSIFFRYGKIYCPRTPCAVAEAAISDQHFVWILLQSSSEVELSTMVPLVVFELSVGTNQIKPFNS